MHSEWRLCKYLYWIPQSLCQNGICLHLNKPTSSVNLMQLRFNDFYHGSYILWVGLARATVPYYIREVQVDCWWQAVVAWATITQLTAILVTLSFLSLFFFLSKNWWEIFVAVLLNLFHVMNCFRRNLDASSPASPVSLLLPIAYCLYWSIEKCAEAWICHVSGLLWM